MDDYEEAIARQPTGPFSKIAERKIIRATSEHWIQRQRYAAEWKRRFKSWTVWIGLGTPIVLSAIKIFEAIFIDGKGH